MLKTKKVKCLETLKNCFVVPSKATKVNNTKRRLSVLLGQQRKRLGGLLGVVTKHFTTFSLPWPLNRLPSVVNFMNALRL